MAAKVLVLLLITSTGFYNLATGKNVGLVDSFDGSSPKAVSYAVAFYTCMWSYGGWERVCQCFDEIQNPKRNMPIILMGELHVTEPKTQRLSYSIDLLDRSTVCFSQRSLLYSHDKRRVPFISSSSSYLRKSSFPRLCMGCPAWRCFVMPGFFERNLFWILTHAFHRCKEKSTPQS